MSSLVTGTATGGEVVAPTVVFCHDDKAAISLRCACALEHSANSGTTAVRFSPTFCGGDEKYISEDIDRDDATPVILDKGLVEVLTVVENATNAPLFSVCILNVDAPGQQSNALCCDVLEFLASKGMKKCILACAISPLPSRWKGGPGAVFVSTQNCPGDVDIFASTDGLNLVDTSGFAFWNRGKGNAIRDPLLNLINQVLGVQGLQAQYFFVDATSS